MYANSSKMLTAQQYIAYICDAQLGSCINFVLAVHLKFSTMPKTSFHCSLPSHLSISYLSLTPIHYWRRTTYICDYQSKLETKKVLRLAMIKSWMDIFFSKVPSCIHIHSKRISVSTQIFCHKHF